MHFLYQAFLSLSSSGLLYVCLLQPTESGIESGVLVLLLRLAQEFYVQNPEEVIVILDLLSRLASFNMVF